MGNYDDIINLPHHESATHPRMPALDRAAQFSPFAALTGHGAAINETARLTAARMELDEDRKQELDECLQMIRGHISLKPEVAITYFVADAKKEGGTYLQARGIVEKLDDTGHKVIMRNGTAIPFNDIYEITGSIFEGAEKKQPSLSAEPRHPPFMGMVIIP